MASLTEVAEYIEDILRLDATTPVQGYSESGIGPANEQAQVLGNRTKWLKEKLEGLSDSLKDILEKKYVISVNEQTGAVEVTLKTLGAAAAVHTHEPSEITTGDAAQFVSKEEKEAWNAKLDKSNIATLHEKSLVEGGDVTLTYSDVGAEKENTASELMTIHTDAENPHKQYLTITDASATYVATKLANSPNGYLKLDENGNIPSELGKLFEVHYYIANDITERLAVPKSNNISICLQLDEDIVYYLDADQDPTIDGNWRQGRSTNITRVNSVFGRFGAVSAEPGDYVASQITETTDKTFVSAAERTTWNGKLSKLENGIDIKTLNNKSLAGEGVVTLTSSDIGADPAGTARNLMRTHLVIGSDPHSEYLNNARGDARYVTLTTANLPGGYVKLTDKGMIPPELGELFQSRYETAANKEERLKIEAKGDMVICLQLDENRVYYLNPGKDPSIDTNWVKGRDLSTGGAVTSVFGRDGNVVAKVDDYTADLITETDTRKFVSPDEKAAWTAKQPALVSGKNIDTINGSSLLEGKDIVITRDTLNAAHAEHTHKPSEITTDDKAGFVSAEEKSTWDGKQDKLVSGSTIATVFDKSLLDRSNIDIADAKNLAEAIKSKLQAGDGVKIELNKETDLITITSTATGSGSSKPVIIELNEAIGGRGYRYKIEDASFTSDFKVFKHGPIFGEAGETVDYDSPAVKPIFNELPAVDEYGGWPNKYPDVDVTVKEITNPAEGQVELYESEYLSTGMISSLTDGVALYCENTLENVVPYFTSSSSTVNFTPIADSSYGDWLPWKAFQAPLTNDQVKPVPDKNSWSSNVVWQNRTGEIYLGIINDEAIKVTGYGFQNFSSLYYNSLSTPPTAWDFQARNGDAESWVTLDSRLGQVIMNGETGWTTYRLDKMYQYKQYRILIKDVVLQSGARAVIPRLAICNDVGMLVKDKDGRYLTADEVGDYKIIDVKNVVDFRNNCFNKPKKPLPVSLFRLVEPVKVCTLKNIGAVIKQYGVEPAIALQNPLIKRPFWDGLKDINPTEYYSDNSDKEIRYAVTVDGELYYYYNDGWEEAGKFTNTRASALLLLQTGMTSDEFVDITEEQWAELLKKASDEPRIGLAFARFVTSTDIPLTPKKIELDFEEIDGWRILSYDKADIRFTDDFVLFNPDEDGTYRLVYRAVQ